MRQQRFLIFFFGFLTFSTAFADEQVGRLKIDEILLRPTYFSQESKGGEFSFNDSQVSFDWIKDEHVSAHIAIGSLLERSIPAIYLETKPPDQLGFIEAYAQYTGIYGHIRAGLVPLGFGSSGLEKNHDRIWPKPMIFAERIVGERDYGVSFFTENNGYFTEFTLHNGEVDQQPNDGNLWLTTRWGWANERQLQIQVSGQAGRTDGVSTALGSTTLAGWDRTKSAAWRFANLAVAWRPRYFEVQLQATIGQREQNRKTDSVTSHQVDFIHYFAKNWGFGLRHDDFDPNTKMSNDRVSRESVMLLNQSSDATSVLSVVYSKVLEEKYQRPNDEAWLQWRVTPFVK